MRKKIFIYDTTLHDSREWPGAFFEPVGRMALAGKLDALGVSYIELSSPPTDPRDEATYRMLVAMPLVNARLTVVGRFPLSLDRLADTEWMAPILSAGTPACTLIIRGTPPEVLETDPDAQEQIFRRLQSAIMDMKGRGIEVLVEVEDFFSGYLQSPEYTGRIVAAGFSGGAERVILNETRGGTLPWQAGKIFHQIFTQFPERSFGVHFHDAGHSALPGVLAVVGQGVVQVQGSINGYGRRSGEANLCNLIPELELKWGYRCLPEGNLPDLLDVAQYFMQTTREYPENLMPYIGRSSFMPA
jgi:2-isopropylmalate synthase